MFKVKFVSVLLSLLICLTFFMVSPLHQLKAIGEEWLTGWGYRKSHIINNATNAGTGYQIKITTYYSAGSDSQGTVYLNGKCRSDFGDIRFTQDDGATLLDYWMEELSSGTYAIFWSEIADDLSSSNVTIYVYYGNSDATTTSNGTDTFGFFDDFSVSPNGWTLTGGANINEGLLKLPSYPDSAYKTRPTSGYDDYRFRFRQRAYFTNNAWRAAPRCPSNIGDVVPFINAFDYFYNPISAVRFFTQGSQSTPIISPARDTNFHVIQVLKASTVYQMTWDSITSGTVSDSTSETGTYVGFKSFQSSQAFHVDWVFLAKYVSPEPTHGSWGSEEEPSEANPPTYSNVGQNSTMVGTTVLFYTLWQDDTNMSKYQFGWNLTSTWQNDTEVYWSPTQTPAWSNITKYLDDNAVSKKGFLIQWCIWAWDVFGNSNDTGLQDFIITTICVSYYFNTGGTLRVNSTDVTNSTAADYAYGTVLNLAALPCNSSFVFQNFTWTDDLSGYNQTNPFNLTLLTNDFFQTQNVTLWCYFDLAGAVPPAAVSSGGMLIIGMTFGLIFALLLIGVRLRKRKEEESNEQLFYNLAYRIRKVREYASAYRV